MQDRHWVFEGTGLRTGDSFGAQTAPPVAGYECDGAPLQAIDLARGLYALAPDGVRCGMPAGFRALAVGPLDERWQELPHREAHDAAQGVHSATLGLCQRGGTVFTTGTVDWAQAMADGSDPAIDHPAQRHKRMREPVGGINPFRQYYRVQTPLRFHTTTGNYIDEETQYRAQRQRPDTPRARDGLKILLVGELACNADRVLALEERGPELHGLWMRDPYWYNTVGPLPFGHVHDLPSDDWRHALRELQRRLGTGVFFDAFDELGEVLRDGDRMRSCDEAVRAHRELFTFDAHADALVAFFRRVMRAASKR